MNTERLTQWTDLKKWFSKFVDSYNRDLGYHKSDHLKMIDALIDEKITALSRQAVTDEDTAIIQKCYDKLLVAVGYADGVENSPDYKTALDFMKEYALQAYHKPVVTEEEAQKALKDLNFETSPELERWFIKYSRVIVAALEQMKPVVQDEAVQDLIDAIRNYGRNPEYDCEISGIVWDENGATLLSRVFTNDEISLAITALEQMKPVNKYVVVADGTVCPVLFTDSQKAEERRGLYEQDHYKCVEIFTVMEGK